MPLDKDIIHDAPPGLSELVDRICHQPSDRAPTHGIWGRIILAVREVVLLLLFAESNVVLLGCEGPRDPNNANAALEVMRDADALDCRIRSAVESLDLLHEWARGLGHEVSETAKRNCSGIQ
eukprot:6693629-Pyramimonas_sp.AAC.1